MNFDTQHKVNKSSSFYNPKWDTLTEEEKEFIYKFEHDKPIFASEADIKKAVAIWDKLGHLPNG